MARPDYIIPPDGPVYREQVALEAILDNLDTQAICDHMDEHRRNGRPGYPVSAMFRAYAAAFALNLDSTNALIRLLRRDAHIRDLCGFEAALPCRRTFNRFVRWLARHHELAERMLTGLTDRLKALLPGLGDVVAVDSTNVRTHANPHRRTVRDPEARWGVKHSPRAKDGDTEYFFGYKVHMVVCATYGLPLAQVVTPGNRGDTTMLPAVMERAGSLYGDWWRPQVVVADRGYDSNANHTWLDSKGVAAVIHIRRATAHDGLYDGVYTKDGIPVCMGKVPMEYAMTDPDTGHHLYICREGGCHLQGGIKGGTIHCDYEVWEDPRDNLRVSGGRIRRGSDEWRALYRQRQTIERTFKSLKQSRRLERHYTRGRRMIVLHALMASIIYQATALGHLQAGDDQDIRWQVERVA